MRAYGWSEDYVRKRITGAKGWFYYYHAIQTEASMFGGGLELSGGYVAQEIERLKKK